MQVVVTKSRANCFVLRGFQTETHKLTSINQMTNYFKSEEWKGNGTTYLILLAFEAKNLALPASFTSFVSQLDGIYGLDAHKN